MTNRQTRRIWWRRNGGASSVLLWESGLELATFCLFWRDMRLARSPDAAFAPLAVSIIRPARSADNAAVSYSYSSQIERVPVVRISWRWG